MNRKLSILALFVCALVLGGIPLLAADCFHHVKQKVVAADVVVAPLVVGIPIVSAGVPVQQYGFDQYWSAQQYYSDRAITRGVLEELKRQGVELPVEGREPPAALTAPPTEAPVPTAIPAAKALTGSREENAMVALMYTNAIGGAKSCAECHGIKSKSGGLALVEPNGLNGWRLAELPSEKWWMAYGKAQVGLMPPLAAKNPAHALPTTYAQALAELAASK
jgi:mono/diheme cytochrome c family protein